MVYVLTSFTILYDVYWQNSIVVVHKIFSFTCLLAERFGNVHAPTTPEDKREQHPEEKVKRTHSS